MSHPAATFAQQWPPMSYPAAYPHPQPQPQLHQQPQAQLSSQLSPQTSLRPEQVSLTCPQQPQQALVATSKSKARKPIDPPVVVQLHVTGGNDLGGQWMSNPFLFALCRLIAPDGSELDKNQANLIGAQTSSLCRLKDALNNEGGFFIFGDLSATAIGKYRLRISVFEFQHSGCQLLNEMESDVFEVMTAKKFPGLQESTVLSRIFSDQGVRLRLRKETKGGKEKRRAQEEVDGAVQGREQSQHEQTSPERKRVRYDHEQQQQHDVFAESSNARTPARIPRPYPTPTAQYSQQVQTNFTGSSYPSSMNMAYFRADTMGAPVAQDCQTPFHVQQTMNTQHMQSFQQQALENGLPSFAGFPDPGIPDPNYQ